MLLESLEGRYPAEASRRHRNAGHAAGPEPHRLCMQIARERAKHAHRGIRAVGITAAMCIVDPVSMAAAAGLTSCTSGWSPVNVFAIAYLPAVGRAWVMQVRHLPNRDHRQGGVTTLTCASAHMPHLFTGSVSPRSDRQLNSTRDDGTGFFYRAQAVGAPGRFYKTSLSSLRMQFARQGSSFCFRVFQRAHCTMNGQEKVHLMPAHRRRTGNAQLQSSSILFWTILCALIRHQCVSVKRSMSGNQVIRNAHLKART